MGSSSHGAGEMCLEAAGVAGGGGRAGRRAGGKKAVAAVGEQMANKKQPQRGLGVAQLEKIRMQNQIMAAYRSGVPPLQAAAMAAGGAASSFQPYRADCFEAMDRRIAADVQYRQYYAENLLPSPCSSTRSPAATSQQQEAPSSPLFVHGAVKGYSPPPSQCHWMSSSHEPGGRSGAPPGSTEELDLELRL